MAALTKSPAPVRARGEVQTRREDLGRKLGERDCERSGAGDDRQAQREGQPSPPPACSRDHLGSRESKSGSSPQGNRPTIAAASAPTATAATTQSLSDPM